MNLIKELLAWTGFRGGRTVRSDRSRPQPASHPERQQPEAQDSLPLREDKTPPPPPFDARSYHAALLKLATAQGEKCLWCRSTNTRRIQADVSRYADRAYDIWHCFDCDVRFSPCAGGPVVDYDAISQRHAWYKLLLCDTQMVDRILANGPERFWAYMACSYINRIPWCASRRFREILHRLTVSAAGGQKLEIIEVGCAMGLMGAVAGHLGHSYLGVDVQCASLETAKSQFGKYGAVFETVGEDWFEQLSSPRQYDIVFSSEVIEHTPDPHLFLEKLLSLAKPGGQVIFTTPDLDRSRDSVWATDLPPVHTVFLHKQAVATAVARLRPSARCELFNEDLGIDWVWVDQRINPARIEEITPNPVARQIDPARVDFFYDVKNVGFSSEISEPRFTLDSLVRQRQLRATLNDVRLLGASMIGVITL